jgi:hypothetical protein
MKNIIRPFMALTALTFAWHPALFPQSVTYPVDATLDSEASDIAYVPASAYHGPFQGSRFNPSFDIMFVEGANPYRSERLTYVLYESPSFSLSAFKEQCLQDQDEYHESPRLFDDPPSYECVHINESQNIAWARKLIKIGEGVYYSTYQYLSFHPENTYVIKTTNQKTKAIALPLFFLLKN